MRRWAHTAVAYDGAMYICGGCNEKGANFKEVMQFGFNTYQWAVLKEVNNVHPSPRDSHASFAHKNKLYLFGGTSSNTRLNDLWEFNIDKRMYLHCAAHPQ